MADEDKNIDEQLAESVRMYMVLIVKPRTATGTLALSPTLACRQF